MGNRRMLFTTFSIVGVIFGYFYLNHLPLEFRFLFYAFVIVSTIMYIIKGRKGNYNKTSITISVLALMLFMLLFMNDLVTQEYTEYLYLQGYIMGLLIVDISAMIIVSAVNYIKVSNRRNRTLMITALLFIALCVIFTIVCIIGKRYSAIS